MNVSYTGSSMKLSRAVAGTGWYAATKSVNLIQDQLYKMTVKVNNVSNMSPSQPAGSNILFFGYENSDGTPWLDYSEGITGTTIGTYTFYVIPKTNSGSIFLGVNNGGGGNFECEIGSVTVDHVAAAFQPLYTAVLNNATDYYAFGMPMPGRQFNSNGYKYGFNGQLKDDEVYGAGNLNSAEYWEYDTRLGRRWNRDPVVKDWESPYACFSDNPVWFSDVNGDSDDKPTKSNPNDPNKKGGKDKFHDETKKLVSQNQEIVDKGVEEMKSIQVAYTNLNGNSGLESPEITQNTPNNQSESQAPTPTGVDVTLASQITGVVGTAIGLGDVATLSGQGKYVTSKGIIKDINFGNLTKNSKMYANGSNTLKTFGRAGIVFSVGLDVYAYQNNQISGPKLTTNLGVTGWSASIGALGMGIPAFIGGTMYFGIDAFYPGGFNGAMDMNGKLMQENQKIIPKFNLYKDTPGGM